MLDVTKFWNNRYKNGGDSGFGSYGYPLYRKLALLRDLDINSIAEIGCGDFHFGNKLLEQYPGVKYTGQDISEVILEKNKEKFPIPRFIDNVDKLPEADLLLCMDVLFHVVDDKEYEKLIFTLKKKWTKYLALTSYEKEDKSERISKHLNIRKFDPSIFGEPIVREIVEEDGEMYFYLFKRDSESAKTGPIDFSKVTCCLITKEKEYPKEILEHLKQFNFGETLILVDSDSPFNKYNLFRGAKNDLIYYQDDDAICPVKELSEQSDPNMINVAMKKEHYEAHKDLRFTMGLGWGAIFPKKVLGSLNEYLKVYGADAVFKRETERILTYLNYPQNRLVLPIKDLPSAYAEDRLWRQPEHEEFKKLAAERCASLVI